MTLPETGADHKMLHCRTIALIALLDSLRHSNRT